MTSRKWTPEQRKAASERAKAQIAAKKKELENEDISDSSGDNSSPDDSQHLESEFEQKVNEPQAQPTVTLTQEQFQMMLDRLSARPEAPATQAAFNQAFPGTTPQLNTQGGVVGVVERFPIDPKHYVNPVEQLYDMPELRRYALRENYIIEWRVTPTKYQTAMGTWYIEPRFELILKKKQYDEEGNELVKYDKNGKAFHPRIVLGRASFFEDPPANIMEAEEAGVGVDDLDKPEFQEKMRMYRYRFWLNEQLNPKRPAYHTNARREEVIGGKVYEIDEYSNPI